MSQEWSKTTRYFVFVLVLGMLVWLLFQVHQLIGPLAVAALLAYVLNPVVTFVNLRSRLSRVWVVLLVYLSFVGILIVAGALLAPLLPGYVANLLQEAQAVVAQVEQSVATPLVVFGVRVPLNQLLAGWPAVTISATVPDMLLGAIQATTTNLVWMLVVLVTAYYLLLDWPRLREWLLGIIPDDYEPDGRRLYAEVRAVWQRYLRGQLRLMVIVGALTGLASAAVGLPGAWAFGLFAGLFDVIVTVGPIVVTAVAVVVAFFLGSTFLNLPNAWFALLVLLVYGALQTVENVWLRPRLMGNALRLHPAVVFVAVVGSLALAGVLTALVIVPLIGSLFVLGRYLYCKLLDLDPWAADPAPEEVPAERAPATVGSKFPDRSW